VGSKKLVVVDRANLDRIREEQRCQLSGEVSDESGKAIGQLLGAGTAALVGVVKDSYTIGETSPGEYGRPGLSGRFRKALIYSIENKSALP
jgi:hypothetical protein